MSVTIIVGLLGNEDKGKLAAYLGLADQPVIAARAGGPDTEHYVEWQGQRLHLRQLSAAVVHPDTRLLVGPAVVVDLAVLLAEVERLGVADRVGIDHRCAVVLPEAAPAAAQPSAQAEATAAAGPYSLALVERLERRATLAADVPELRRFLADVPLELNTAATSGQPILIEGCHGYALSLYHGSGPTYVDRDTTAQAFCADVGLGPVHVTHVIVTLSAQAARSANAADANQRPAGAPPAWSDNPTGDPTRRYPDFDWEIARRAVLVNGATQLAISGLDRRFHRAGGVQRRGSLPPEARQFIDTVENALGVPIALISTGSQLEHMIDLR